MAGGAGPASLNILAALEGAGADVGTAGTAKALNHTTLRGWDCTEMISLYRTRAREPSQLLPRDCSAQALLRPHNDGSLHSNQKGGCR
jgi:hypothetical protein